MCVYCGDLGFAGRGGRQGRRRQSSTTDGRNPHAAPGGSERDRRGGASSGAKAGTQFRIGLMAMAGKGLGLSTTDPTAFGVLPWGYISMGASF
jgi:hypothetical protein